MCVHCLGCASGVYGDGACGLGMDGLVGVTLIPVTADDAGCLETCCLVGVVLTPVTVDGAGCLCIGGLRGVMPTLVSVSGGILVCSTCVCGDVAVLSAGVCSWRAGLSCCVCANEEIGSTSLCVLLKLSTSSQSPGWLSATTVSCGPLGSCGIFAAGCCCSSASCLEPFLSD